MSNVAVNVRVTAHVIVKIMTDGTAFHLHPFEPADAAVRVPGAPPIA